MRLQVQHLIGRDTAQKALQTLVVRPVKEELLPEALGELCVVFIFLSQRSAPGAQGGGRECTHAEERLVEIYDFGLERLL